MYIYIKGDRCVISSLNTASKTFEQLQEFKKAPWLKEDDTFTPIVFILQHSVWKDKDNITLCLIDKKGKMYRTYDYNIINNFMKDIDIRLGNDKLCVLKDKNDKLSLDIVD